MSKIVRSTPTPSTLATELAEAAVIAAADRWWEKACGWTMQYGSESALLREAVRQLREARQPAPGPSELEAGMKNEPAHPHGLVPSDASEDEMEAANEQDDVVIREWEDRERLIRIEQKLDWLKWRINVAEATRPFGEQLQRTDPRTRTEYTGPPEPEWPGEK